MGAWDITAFGNDTAADWAADLQESPDPVEVLETTFQRVLRTGYLEAPEGSEMVAAAAVVAASCGGAVRGMPEDLEGWLAPRASSLKHLAPAALAAMRRVLAPESELRELWEESDDLQPWLEDMDRIAVALR
jgi:hypothetical protein